MLPEKVSRRIGDYMKQKEISFSELSVRTGLNESFLHSVIKENAYPSLGPLQKIARALGVRLGTFLDDQMSRDPLLIRLSERTEEMRMTPSTDSLVTSRYYSLGRGKADRHMEPFFIEMLPVDQTEKALSSHEGEEFIVVTSGKVELIYGKQRFELEAGDSIYYNSVVPHWVGCSGAEPAHMYAVLYFPE